MNTFQWIALPVLAFLFAIDLGRLIRHPFGRLDRLVRCLTWLAAGLAIYRPDWTTRVARAIGIESGAHLVLYASVLGFLGVAFFLYARTVRLERQITDLVRHIAITNARKNPPANAS